MAEPTGTAAGVATFIGATALIGALFGVEPQTLIFATVGAIFGEPLAPPAGTFRKVLLFIGVVVASAMLGAWAAEYFSLTGKYSRNGCALAIAFAFHPLSAAFVQAVPAMARAVFRVPGGGQP